jgi:hypothetical protein
LGERSAAGQAISAAPALQDTYDYDRGTQEADRRYPGEPSMRFAFNAGVNWMLDQMGTV